MERLGSVLDLLLCLPNCYSTLSARDSTMSNQAQQSQSLSDRDLRHMYVAWFRSCYGRYPIFDIPPHQIEFARYLYLLGQGQLDAGKAP
jgi:hypothetical protein